MAWIAYTPVSQSIKKVSTNLGDVYYTEYVINSNMPSSYDRACLAAGQNVYGTVLLSNRAYSPIPVGQVSTVADAYCKNTAGTIGFIRPATGSIGYIIASGQDYHGNENLGMIMLMKFNNGNVAGIAYLAGSLTNQSLTPATNVSFGSISGKSRFNTSTPEGIGLSALGINVSFGNALVAESSTNISDGVLTITPNTYVYDGEFKTPAVTLTLNGNQLTENTDYTKTYTNNRDIGTASVQCAGIAPYTGSISGNFTITAPDISDATILITPSVFYYNSHPCEPTVEVSLAGRLLTEGVEYSKTYTNNINPGTASVTIAGISPYIGSQTLTFDIIKRSVTNANITVYPMTFIYDGYPKTPTVTVECDGTVLRQSVDYTVTYANNTEVGTASCVIAATLDTYWLTGSATVPFAIITSGGVDPYSEGGTVNPYPGGDGEFETVSDTITEPSAPTASVVDAGFCRMYNPSISQLKSLASYMWTDNTFLDTVINHVKQLFENPMDAIISLSLFPCPVEHGTNENVNVMYIPTGVQMPPVTNQYPIINCGDVLVEKRYDSALDYSPYTEVSCFLPFIGTVTLDTDEVMGKYIAISYHIDLASGMCVAFIKVDGSVLYQYSGHCSISQPLSSADYASYIGAALQATKMVGGIIAAGTGHPAVAAELVGGPRYIPEQTSTREVTTKSNIGLAEWHTSEVSTIPARGMSFGEVTRKGISNSVSAVMGSKATIQHTGGFSGASGFLGERRPYLTIKRPRIANPAQYGKYNGRPSLEYMQLAACQGYTEVQSIQLTDITATVSELSEISELLKSGVIF